MTTFKALGFFMIFAVAFPCNARSAEALGNSVRLQLMGGRPVVDGVYLNGEGPFRFLLDTGAQTNQLDAPIARSLGLTPAFQVEMATSTGFTKVAGARLAKVSLASATAGDQEFLFGGLEGIHKLAPDVQGVLGQEFLSHFDYLLDLANRRLAFGAAIPDGGSRLDFAVIDGRPVIETSEGRLELDSGTDAPILFRATASKVGSGPSARMLTSSGVSSVSVLSTLRLKIAGKDYRASNAAVLPKSSDHEIGLLPASLFHAVYFCNSESYVILDPSAGSSTRRTQGRRTYK